MENNTTSPHIGIRAYFSGLALQGILANEYTSENEPYKSDSTRYFFYAKESVAIADALIRELQERVDEGY